MKGQPDLDFVISPYRISDLSSRVFPRIDLGTGEAEPTNYLVTYCGVPINGDKVVYTYEDARDIVECHKKGVYK